MGSLAGLSLSYNDFLTDLAANETLAEFVRCKIRQLVSDPCVAEILSPRDYPIGARRVCLESDYYTTFNRDNVSLVDLRSTPIVAITASGIETTASSYELDGIVLPLVSTR